MVVLFLVLSYPFTRSQTGAFSLSGDSSKNMELSVRPFRVTTTRGRKWKIFQKSLLPSSSRFPFCFHARLKVASVESPFFVTLGKNDTLNSEKWTKEEEGKSFTGKHVGRSGCALFDVSFERQTCRKFEAIRPNATKFAGMLAG